MDIDTGPALLGDLANCATLTANDRTDHITLDEQTQWEIVLAAWNALALTLNLALALYGGILWIATGTAWTTPLLIQWFGMQFTALELDAIQSTGSPRIFCKNTKENIVSFLWLQRMK